MFEDGEQVLKYFMMRLRAEEIKGDRKKKQIACLLILEINMTGSVGNEVLKQIKSLFEPIPHLVRPLTCYLSSTKESVMSQFITEDELAELYFEKPIAVEDLTTLIKLIDSR